MLATAGRFARPVSRHARTFVSLTDTTFREGDRALIQDVANQQITLSKPLHREKMHDVSRGSINHEQILGRKARDTVLTSHGRPYRLLVPTLEDYVTLTPRRVTPIYPVNANVIVSQLDIHVSPSESDLHNEQRYEILEAGTGHGALTLYLARAIHAANPTTPRLSFERNVEFDEQGQAQNPDLKDMWADSGLYGLPAPFPEEWRDKRRAVLHTLDISPENSLHARKIVRGFRQGIYSGDVDFHIGNVSAWLQKEIERRAIHSNNVDSAFLSHIILDLPDCGHTLEDAASALRPNGRLLVFAPSVTQIASCVEQVKLRRLPLLMDTVLELGQSISGGREWDVRTFTPRSRQTSAKDEDPLPNEEAMSRSVSQSGGHKAGAENKSWELICRPRVGVRTVNGGFLGVWQRMEKPTTSAEGKEMGS